jgi:crotonobetainyl-CoA:carnitine CoA-transferase CaiB-like acyl-CoA transferase
VKRDATGKGEYIDVAMLDSTISLLGYLASSYFMTGESPQAVGGGHHSLVPYGVFEAKDGYMVIAVLTESIWPRLCLAAGLEDLAADDRYADNARRLERRTEVERLVGAAIRRRAIAEWCEILTEADVPHAPILSVAAALEQPQVQERGLIREVMHPAIGPTRTLGPVISFSSSGTGAVAPAPLLGADTEMVLRQIAKYSEEVVAKLEKDGVIHRAPPC